MEKPFSGHEFKKSLGQNFISDKNLLASIAKDAGVTSEDVVIEVGAGAGTLTEVLGSCAKQVISFEVDESLRPLLNEKEETHKNLKVVFKDILKVDINEIHKLITEVVGEFKSYKLVANIPYYITTPIILKFIEDEMVDSLTIMVQKEVAERIASTPEHGDYGSISAAIGVVGEAKLARVVKKQNFYPMPKVDSAILQINLYKGRDLKNAKKLFTLIRSAFKNKRKKLSSNVCEDFKIEKSALENILVEMGYSQTSRAEELSSQDYRVLLEKIEQIKK